MWFNKPKKNNVSHTVCNTCEYRTECFPLLRLWHIITHLCRQGRKAPIRVRAKDQVTLDQVIPKGE